MKNRIKKTIAAAIISAAFFASPASAHENDMAYIPDVLYALPATASTVSTQIVQVPVYDARPQTVVIYRESRYRPAPRVIYYKPRPQHSHHYGHGYHGHK